MSSSSNGVGTAPTTSERPSDVKDKPATKRELALLAKLSEEAGREPPNVTMHAETDAAIKALLARKNQMRAAAAYAGSAVRAFCHDCEHEWDAPLNHSVPCPSCGAPENYCFECDREWHAAAEETECRFCGEPL